LEKSTHVCNIEVTLIRPTGPRKVLRAGSRCLAAVLCITAIACAPRITNITPDTVFSGRAGAVMQLPMRYLVGWPRVEVGGRILDWPQLKLLAADPDRKDVPGEELIWIEDKVLQFTIPELSPADYRVVIHDDKGPPGDPVYAALETTAYVIFPPVWPFVFRSNQTEFTLRVLPSN
jgi:hypothetical protein